MTDLNELAKRYLKEEPFDLYREEIEFLLNTFEKDKSARAELENRLLSNLQFGTAGIRAKMQAGYNRFNLVTVSKAAYATGQYLLHASINFDVKSKGIVIGYDARLNSKDYAEECAQVLTGLGFHVYVFSEMVATPICAFAVRHLQAAMGIMITASHNPPQDNGFKVYSSNGAQIMEPVDKEIENWIVKAPLYSEILRLSTAEQNEKKLCTLISQKTFDAYFNAIKHNQFHKTKNTTKIKIVYTPLHGVGKKFTERALFEAGFTNVHCVVNQSQPDGHFPTVAFPNPEEKGALDEAILLANQINADLVLANDPDADRLAVLIRKPLTHEFVALTGNEIGVLLGTDAILYAPAEGKQKLVITTIVSSQMLSKIASSENVAYAEVLTGFSKIAKAALEKEKNENQQFIFGYEEALGYAVGNQTLDKDGISAAVRFCELFAYLKEKEQTCWSKLDELNRRYGLYLGLQWSIRFDGLTAQSKMSAFMDDLRENKILLKDLAGEKIASKEDYLQKAKETYLKANVFIYRAKARRLIVRPSGTEPKIKFYLEINEKVKPQDDLNQKRREATKLLMQIKDQLLSQFGLS